jgi:hypothetical protein
LLNVIRVLVLALAIVAATAFHPTAARAAACDSVHLFSLHTAEQSAWDGHKYADLIDLDIEEGKYDDACGHKETGTQRALDLQSAATHYSDAGSMELGRKQFALAKQHFIRSNQIIAELFKTGTAPQPDMLKSKQIFNKDGIRRADAKISSAA